MHRIALSIAAFIVLASAGWAQVPEMPKPTKEHELLRQFAGEWDTRATAEPVPGEEPMHGEGTENARMVGGFWLVGQSSASIQGMAMASVMTIGYDPATKKYVGTFICSMDSTLWQYQGTMDETGKKLTLETKGPSCIEPGKQARYREILELKDQDHKQFTSFIEGEDGNWTQLVTVEYVRKK